jgi:nitrogen-specific signal transduction histidine kinase
MVEEETKELLAAERLACIRQTVATLAHSIKNIIGGLKGGMFVLEKGIDLCNSHYLDEGWMITRGNMNKIKNLTLDLFHLMPP